MREAALTTFDGTRLVYQVSGHGERWLVVANGYGGTFNSWQAILPLLAPHFRVLIWDYRGTHASATPSDRRALSIADQCRDLEVLLDHEHIERCVLAGWSVGVQVALEAAFRLPDRIEALALLNGAPDRILRQLYGGGPLSGLTPLLVQGLRRILPLVWPAVRPLAVSAAGSAAFAAICGRVGVTDGRPALFPKAAQSMMTLDMGVFMGMVLLADGHSRRADWGRLSLPVLVTAGSRDALTPPAVCRRIAEAIPAAQFVEFDGSTHYVLLERPAAVAETIIAFVTDALGAPTNTTAS